MRGTSYVIYGMSGRQRTYQAKSVPDAQEFAANLRYVLSGIDEPWPATAVRWSNEHFTIEIQRIYSADYRIPRGWSSV